MPADTHTTQPPQLGVAGSSWLHLGAWDMPQGEPRGAKEDLYSGLSNINKCIIGASGVHALKLLEEVFGVSWECLGAPAVVVVVVVVVIVVLVVVVRRCRRPIANSWGRCKFRLGA